MGTPEGESLGPGSQAEPGRGRGILSRAVKGVVGAGHCTEPVGAKPGQ